MCLSKTRLVADSLEKSRLLVLIFQGFVPLKCIYSRRIPLVAGFSKYVARRALQTCLRGRFGRWLVPPSCLRGEKSNKCNQFICAFFHNNKRLIKKHTAGERNAGSSPELVAGQVPTWAAVSVWVVGGVPSCAQLCPMCPALPCSSSSSVRSWHIRLAPIVTHGDQAVSWQKLTNACHKKLERWLS